MSPGYATSPGLAAPPASYGQLGELLSGTRFGSSFVLYLIHLKSNKHLSTKKIELSSACFKPFLVRAEASSREHLSRLGRCVGHSPIARACLSLEMIVRNRLRAARSYPVLHCDCKCDVGCLGLFPAMPMAGSPIRSPAQLGSTITPGKTKRKALLTAWKLSRKSCMVSAWMA